MLTSGRPGRPTRHDGACEQVLRMVGCGRDGRRTASVGASLGCGCGASTWFSAPAAGRSAPGVGSRPWRWIAGRASRHSFAASSCWPAKVGRVRPNGCSWPELGPHCVVSAPILALGCNSTGCGGPTCSDGTVGEQPRRLRRPWVVTRSWCSWVAATAKVAALMAWVAATKGSLHWLRKHDFVCVVF